MFAKLLLIILVLGAAACTLLVNRQQRIEAAHEAAALHERLAGQRRSLWRLRAEVAARCRPAEVHEAVAAAGGEWSPLLVPPPELRR